MPTHVFKGMPALLYHAVPCHAMPGVHTEEGIAQAAALFRMLPRTGQGEHCSTAAQLPGPSLGMSHDHTMDQQPLRSQGATRHMRCHEASDAPWLHQQRNAPHAPAGKTQAHNVLDSRQPGCQAAATPNSPKSLSLVKISRAQSNLPHLNPHLDPSSSCWLLWDVCMPDLRGPLP